MTKVRIVGAVLAVLVPMTASQVAVAGLGVQAKSTSRSKPASATKKIPAPEIDGLMAPVALYPDQLLAQMLVCATTPARVTDLDKWLKTNPPFKGTALQDAAKQSKFEPSFVALVPFPQVVDFMATNLDWTTGVGQAFSADRAGVLDSVQRLRADSLKAGKLKSTPQQSTIPARATGGSLPGPIAPRDVTITPDLANAAPFLAAAAITGGSVTVPNWPRDTHQAGDAIRQVLTRVRRAGDARARLAHRRGHRRDPRCPAGPEPRQRTGAGGGGDGGAGRRHDPHPRRRAHPRSRDGPDLRAGPRAGGASAPACTRHRDGLTIHPRLLGGATWHTYADHRMAHAGALLGLVVDDVEIDDIGCVAKTMPEFVELWTRMLGDAERLRCGLREASGRSQILRPAGRRPGCDVAGPAYRRTRCVRAPATPHPAPHEGSPRLQRRRDRHRGDGRPRPLPHAAGRPRRDRHQGPAAGPGVGDRR